MILGYGQGSGRLPRWGDGFNAQVVTLALEADQIFDLSTLRAVPGARSLTGSLSSQSWAVVTSGSRFVATTRMNAVDIQLPSVMVTAEDVSRGKPDPEGYLAAAASLGVDAADCVVVEDARSGVLAARAAGMTVVGIDGFSLGCRSDVSFVVRDLRDLQVQRGESDTGLLVSSRDQGDRDAGLAAGTEPGRRKSYSAE